MKPTLRRAFCRGKDLRLRNCLWKNKKELSQQKETAPIFTISVGNVGQECNLTCALDGGSQLTLMLCTSSGDSSGKNLAALGNELSELCGILIVDISNLALAEYANLFSLAVILISGTLLNISLDVVIHLMKSSC